MGILAWIVRGAVKYYREGLGQVPDSVRHQTQEYREENDPLAEFIEDRFTLDPTGFVTGQDAYREYLAWAEEQGFSQKETADSKEIKRYLRAHFPADRISSARGYRGIRLNSQGVPLTLANVKVEAPTNTAWSGRRADPGTRRPSRGDAAGN